MLLAVVTPNFARSESFRDVLIYQLGSELVFVGGLIPGKLMASWFVQVQRVKCCNFLQRNSLSVSSFL